MRVNKKTMLLEDLSQEDILMILPVVEAFVLNGVNPLPAPQWLDRWFTECGFKEDRRLLVLSTVMPQRILLSITRAMSTHAL